MRAALSGFRPNLIRAAFILAFAAAATRVGYVQNADTFLTRYGRNQWRADEIIKPMRGAIYDAIIDLRPDSPTFRRWVGYELSAENRRMLYVPEGVAHGFETLVADTEVFYQMSEFYFAECQRGVRWDDPAFGVAWPMRPVVISDRDAGYPDFSR